MGACALRTGVAAAVVSSLGHRGVAGSGGRRPGHQRRVGGDTVLRDAGEGPPDAAAKDVKAQSVARGHEERREVEGVERLYAERRVLGAPGGPVVGAHAEQELVGGRPAAVVDVRRDDLPLERGELRVTGGRGRELGRRVHPLFDEVPLEARLDAPAAGVVHEDRTDLAVRHDGDVDVLGRVQDLGSLCDRPEGPRDQPLG